MKKLRTLIVDDERSARMKVRHMLQEYPQVEVIDEATDGQMAVEKIRDLQPDLVFLDIQMPEKTGLEVAMETLDLKYKLVFVTAYDEFALKAFESHAVDYLLKPVSSRRLKRCMDKICDQEPNIAQKQLQDLMAQIFPKAQDNKVGIRHGAATLLIDLDNIAYIRAEEGYSRVFLNKKGQAFHNLPSLLSDSPLDHMIEQLSSNHFLRVHRSVIIRKDQVRSYHSDGRNLYLTLIDHPQEKLPVSRAHIPLVKQLWKVI